MNKRNWAILGAVIVLAGVAYWAYANRVRISPQGEILIPQHENELSGEVVEVNYACAEGKDLRARIELKPGNQAEVFLPDNSKLLLTQATSGSGVRYVNKGESFVFWTKGDTAFVDEGGVISFKDCVIK